MAPPIGSLVYADHTWTNNMQHPEQGLPSPTQDPNPDLEAMKKAHNNAISSNERIFPIFAQKLASKDTKEFVSTVRKLALWLRSEKAYYPAARPNIVHLLETALLAFSETFIHHPAVAELTKDLQGLVEVVIPFKDLFPENALQSRLQRVIFATRSLSGITATAHTQTQTERSVTANVPSPTIASPVYPQPAVPPISAPQIPDWRIQAALLTPSIANEDSGGTFQVDSPQERNPSQAASSDQIEAIISLASPVSNTRWASENISAVPSKPQPKRVRRTELTEELVARDLDWFKSNQGSMIRNNDSSVSPSKVIESSPSLGFDAPHVPRQSLSPKKKTARMVPSRRLPRRVPLDATQRVESAPSTSALPHSTEPWGGVCGDAQNVPIQMDVDGKFPSLEKAESGAHPTALQEARNVQEGSRPEESPSPGLQPAVVSSNESSIERQLRRTDHQPPSIEHPPINVESSIFAHPPVPLPEAMSDRTESMDISKSDMGSEKLSLKHPAKTMSTPPGSPRVLRLRSPLLPPLANSLQPPLDLNFRISQMSPGQPRQSGLDAVQVRFDDEMAIIHSIQAKPFTHTHVVDFNLSKSVFSAAFKWANRRSRPFDAPQGVCISLGCYRLLELFNSVRSKNGKHDTIEALTSRSSCSWPSSDRLWLHIKDGERPTTITLSPPLFLTPDQCVDVSSLMKLGKNTLEIRQRDDLSEYLMVLHAHPPTQAQLAELDTIKAADERWRRFLDVISARVVSEKMLGNACVGIIEVS